MKIDGRKRVKTIQREFKEEFGLTLRMYHGARFAEESDTLASIRTKDVRSGTIEINKNDKIVDFENKMKELFGLRVQVASADNEKLCDNDLTLAQAKKECK